MLNAIFYLIVILCVFAGYKKGAVAAGHFYIAIGMGVYFSVWLLPFVLPAVDMVPESYREYALPLFLLLPLFQELLQLHLCQKPTDKPAQIFID